MFSVLFADDSTGEYSVYTTFHNREIMFHVSTLLPWTPNNKQQVSVIIENLNDLQLSFCVHAKGQWVVNVLVKGMNTQASHQFRFNRFKKVNYFPHLHVCTCQANEELLKKWFVRKIANILKCYRVLCQPCCCKLD